MLDIALSMTCRRSLGATYNVGGDGVVDENACDEYNVYGLR